MATAILRPQDCLGNGLCRQAPILSSPPLKTRRNPNSNPSTSHVFGRDADASSSGRRKRNPVGVRQINRGRSRSGEPVAVAKPPAKNLVMGQVKILKRGEVLSPENGNRGVADVNSCKLRLEMKVEDMDFGLGSTHRLGPDPDLMQKQVMISDLKVIDGIYAGSGATFASPPPSSVPLPSFLGKNGSATSDLRRLLRLDLD